MKSKMPLTPKRYSRLSKPFSRIFSAFRRPFGRDISQRLHGMLWGAVLVCTVCLLVILIRLLFPYGLGFRSVSIPDLKGDNLQSARSALKGEAFCLSVEYAYHAGIADNVVLEQTPKAGLVRRLYSGSGPILIRLTVNKTPTFTLPQLAGMSIADVELLLKNNQVKLVVQEEFSESAPKQTVIDTSPPAGYVLSPEDTLIVRVSLGSPPEFVDMPDLLGIGEGVALSLLSAKGLSAERVIYAPSELPIGSVIAQSIPPQASVAKGSAVSITVSGGIHYPADDN